MSRSAAACDVDVADAFEMREDRHPRLAPGRARRGSCRRAARSRRWRRRGPPASRRPRRGRASARAGWRRPAGRPARRPSRSAACDGAGAVRGCRTRRAGSPALPALRHSAPASAVTLGRLSKMTPMTPSGVATRSNARPFGRSMRPAPRPTGSGRAGDLLHGAGHGLEPRRVERQPVDERALGAARRARRRHPAHWRPGCRLPRRGWPRLPPAGRRPWRRPARWRALRGGAARLRPMSSISAATSVGEGWRACKSVLLAHGLQHRRHLRLYRRPAPCRRGGPSRPGRHSPEWPRCRADERPAIAAASAAVIGDQSAADLAAVRVAHQHGIATRRTRLRRGDPGRQQALARANGPGGAGIEVQRRRAAPACRRSTSCARRRGWRASGTRCSARPPRSAPSGFFTRPSAITMCVTAGGRDLRGLDLGAHAAARQFRAAPPAMASISAVMRGNHGNELRRGSGCGGAV